MIDVLDAGHINNESRAASCLKPGQHPSQRRDVIRVAPAGEADRPVGTGEHLQQRLVRPAGRVQHRKLGHGVVSQLEPVAAQCRQWMTRPVAVHQELQRANASWSAGVPTSSVTSALTASPRNPSAKACSVTAPTRATTRSGSTRPPAPYTVRAGKTRSVPLASSRSRSLKSARSARPPPHRPS